MNKQTKKIYYRNKHQITLNQMNKTECTKLYEQTHQNKKKLYEQAHQNILKYMNKHTRIY